MQLHDTAKTAVQKQQKQKQPQQQQQQQSKEVEKLVGLVKKQKQQVCKQRKQCSPDVPATFVCLRAKLQCAGLNAFSGSVSPGYMVIVARANWQGKPGPLQRQQSEQHLRSGCCL